MLRERIANDVYWFQSEIYAQVTAGAVVGPEWAIVIDTLALPEETLAIREFIEGELKVPVRYIINTIYHADHTWGNCFFPGAIVIAHALCYRYMIEKNIKALKEVKAQDSVFAKTRIVLPSLTFTSGTISLQVGKKHLKIFSTPGSSLDCIAVLLHEDRILFAGDAFMPIPYIVEGDLEQLTETIMSIEKMGLENIIQGHGDIILRGEIEQAIKDNLAYLAAIKKVVKTAIRRKDPNKKLQEATVESCGKSHVLLGGLVKELHKRNLIALLQQEISGKNG
ncbi:MAG TPA: MBL fold metallo-hydrolase [Anaerolineae bacterium]|nr:MBL fold metallo-hydrolase [Anaerolineae bacterium]